jgi:hypothetical protein
VQRDSRKKQLNPHMGSESHDIRVNSALPENLLTNGFVNNCGRLFGPSEQFEAGIVEVGLKGPHSDITSGSIL